ncbi:hypothetical protein ACH5AL_24505 [Actinacidiphila glaucinigra]|uniref:hypothetical protein n=1 Tax=Actinacidiphila glaucinigra TaxID=235986 RepID=UPI0037A7BE91
MEPTYKPSDELKAALREWEESIQAELDKRHALRRAVADELKATGITNSVISEHLPWTQETVRGIANEYGVPRHRAPKTPKQPSA